MSTRAFFGLLCLSACSLLVKRAPLCGDGDLDPGELCYNEQRLGAELAPVSIEIKDLDGDGDLDIANSNFGQNSLTVFLNKGKGDFGAPSPFTTSAFPNQISVADFNGDGLLDAAVICAGPLDAQGVFVNNGVLSLLPGQGDGTFGPKQDITLVDAVALLDFKGTQTLASGDINGDGTLDLVVGSTQTKNIAVLLNGAAGFATPKQLLTNSQNVGLTLGDLDGDGDLDLLSADNAVLDVNNQLVAGSTLSLFEGDGTGAFAAPVTLDVGNAPLFPVLGDLDGDGTLDIAVTNAISGTLSVLLNKGGLQFTSQPALKTGSRPIGLTLADLDGDGDLDIASDDSLDDTVRAFVNDGKASFTATQPIAVGPFPELLASGDLNEDGVVDLAVADTDIINGASSDLSLLLSTP